MDREEKGCLGRKVEMAEEDFLSLIELKRFLDSSVHTACDMIDDILAKHTVRDPAWKGQVVAFEKKKIPMREGD